MKKIIIAIAVLVLCSLLPGCNGQTTNSPEAKNSKIVGGGCDGCELMYVGIPKEINSVDTSAGWTEKGQKLLITGTVYKIDGKTPAPNVIIYYWQTDNNGLYSPNVGMDERVKRHGHIRGWVKTDEEGKYAIYTIRPASYPNNSMPAHIHLSIKESSIDNEYYIDEFVFDDDKLLTGNKRKTLENRGGSGILRVLVSGDLQIAEHNIILGLNIPNYPEKIKDGQQSGLQIGEGSPSFRPHHAFGPDKGTTTCPVCKYGRYHGILFFVGNKPEWADIKKWLAFLESESLNRGKYLKAFFIYGNEKNYIKNSREKELEKIGTELNLKNIALTYVPSLRDSESEVDLNKINPDVENTFIIFRQSTIISKFIDLKATTENFKLVSNTLEKTTGNYFNLSAPAHD